jgi:hypothetical protein
MLSRLHGGTEENISQDSRSLDRYLNSEPPEYETGVDKSRQESTGLHLSIRAPVYFIIDPVLSK